MGYVQYMDVRRCTKRVMENKLMGKKVRQKLRNKCMDLIINDLEENLEWMTRRRRRRTQTTGQWWWRLQRSKNSNSNFNRLWMTCKTQAWSILRKTMALFELLKPLRSSRWCYKVIRWRPWEINAAEEGTYRDDRMIWRDVVQTCTKHFNT